MRLIDLARYSSILLAQRYSRVRQIPIFEPFEKYEREGEIANVVFSCGAVVRGDTLFLYYGAADRVIGVATASISHMLDTLS